MLLATTQVEDFDHFLEVFSTKGAEKRKEHGSKGALVFRDPAEDDRVWVIFDWDEQGWQSFVSDPDVPPIMKEAGHKTKAAGRAVRRALRRLTRTEPAGRRRAGAAPQHAALAGVSGAKEARHRSGRSRHHDDGPQLQCEVDRAAGRRHRVPHRRGDREQLRGREEQRLPERRDVRPVRRMLELVHRDRSQHIDDPGGDHDQRQATYESAMVLSDRREACQLLRERIHEAKCGKASGRTAPRPVGANSGRERVGSGRYARPDADIFRTFPPTA